jgi:hypothetical protein
MSRDHAQTRARPGVNVLSVHDHAQTGAPARRERAQRHDHVNFSASHPTAFHDRVDFSAAFDGFFT